MAKSGVPWARYTWNPWEGCSEVSEACAHCYARSLARRFHRPWGAPVFHEDRLGQPAATRKPGRVFVCSTSDFWHEDVKPEWRKAATDAMAAAPWHTYLILTKRPQNIPACFVPTPNIWLGVTAENQERYEERFGILSQIPTVVRFVSCEPLLGPISIDKWNGRQPSWVIAGPETGVGAREMKWGWMKDMETQCRFLGIPFFSKVDGWLRREYPEGRQ